MPRGVPRWKMKEPDPIPPIPMDDNLVFLWECLQYSNYTSIDFKTVGRAFEMTRDEALECFKDLRKAVEHAICQDFIEKSNAQRAKAGLSSVLRRGNDGAPKANAGPSTAAGPSNTGQANAGSARAGASNANPAANAGPSNAAQPVSQHRQDSTPDGQASENARAAPVATNQTFNVSSAAPVNSAGPSNTVCSNARPVNTGQTTGNARFAPVRTSQTFSQPRPGPVNQAGSSAAGPSTAPSSAGRTTSTGQQVPVPRNRLMPPIQPFNLPRAGPVLLDMTGLGCFLGRTDAAPVPRMPNTSSPRVGQSPRPTNVTRAFSNPIAEADPSKVGESESGKPSMSERASTSPAKKDKGKKRKRASEDEDDMDVDKSPKKKGAAK